MFPAISGQFWSSEGVIVVVPSFSRFVSQDHGTLMVVGLYIRLSFMSVIFVRVSTLFCLVMRGGQC